MRTVWAVEKKTNPHVWDAHHPTLVVVYGDREQAENFVAIHPQHHYRVGESEPRIILEVREIQLGEILCYWNPSFP